MMDLIDVVPQFESFDIPVWAENELSDNKGWDFLDLLKDMEYDPKLYSKLIDDYRDEMEEDYLTLSSSIWESSFGEHSDSESTTSSDAVSPSNYSETSSEFSYTDLNPSIIGTTQTAPYFCQMTGADLGTTYEQQTGSASNICYQESTVSDYSRISTSQTYTSSIDDCVPWYKRTFEQTTPTHRVMTTSPTTCYDDTDSILSRIKTEPGTSENTSSCCMGAGTRRVNSYLKKCSKRMCREASNNDNHKMKFNDYQDLNLKDYSSDCSSTSLDAYSPTSSMIDDVTSYRAPSPEETPVHRRKPGRKPGQCSKGYHLWEFMRDLLCMPDYCPRDVDWIDKENGIFRIVNSRRVSTLWGQKKHNKKPMTYEKLSRALRFSRTAGYFTALPKDSVYPKKLCFKFGPKALGWRRPQTLRF